jgi:hypothetical protein
MGTRKMLLAMKATRISQKVQCQSRMGVRHQRRWKLASRVIPHPPHLQTPRP